MNKTFKVVFNRARGALMVANEVTSSVQKKGTKTIIAAALLSVFGASVYAEETTQYSNGTFTFEENTTISTTTASGENNRYSGIAATESGKTTSVTVADGKTLTINGKLEDVSGAERIYLISAQTDSKVTVKGNIVGTISESSDSDSSIFGISGNAGEITVDGTLNATVTGGKGASNDKGEAIGAYAANSAHLTFSGSKTEFNVTTQGRVKGLKSLSGATIDFNAAETKITADNSKGSDWGTSGLYAYQGEVNFTSSNTEITVKGNTTDTMGVNVLCDPGNAHVTKVNFSGDKTLIDVSATSGDVYAVSPSGDPGEINFNGKTATIKAYSKSGKAYGVQTQYGAIVNSNSDLAVTAQADGTKAAYGVAIENYGPENNYYAGNVAFNKSLTATVTAANANAYGLYSEAKLTATSATTHGAFSVKGKSNLIVSSTAKDAYGVMANDNAKTIELTDVDIVANSATGNVYGIYGNKSVDGTADTLVNATGNVTIVATTNTGKAYGVNLSGATTAKLEGNVDIDVKATGEKAEAYGVYANKRGTVTLGSTDKNVSIKSDYRGVYARDYSKVTVDGSTIDIDATSSAVKLDFGGAITIGSASTKTVKLSSGGDAIAHYGNATSAEKGFTGSEIGVKRGGTITIEAADSIEISSKDSGCAAIWVQSCTEETTAPETHSTVNVSAENISLTGNIGIAALSNSEVNLKGNTTITAVTNALNVRGYSTVNINTDRKHSTKLAGNIVFETDWPDGPSGSYIDANVNLVLSGSESSWNGRSYQQYKVNSAYEKRVGLEGNDPKYGNVTGFNLTIADGAKWKVTDDSFVNTLTLDGGEIDATDAKILNVGKFDAEKNKVVAGFTIKGTDNKLTLGSETTLNGAITMVEDSELITPLATAFTTTTEKDVVTDAKARLTVSDGSDKSAKLTINDIFTYTTDALKTMAKAYEAITLNLTKATLAASETEKAELVDGVIQVNTTVTADTTDGKTTIGASSSSADTAVTTGAQTIELDKTAEVTVKADSNVTLVGKTDGSDFIKNATKVDVAAGATLNLGSVETEKATTGTLPEVTLASGAVLNVTNTAVTTSSLTGGESVKINLGTTEAAGVLHTEALSLKGATIFLDPAWQNGSTISDASSLSAVTVSDLNGTIVAGQNSIVALGATKDAAVAGFNKLAQWNGLAWGESGITAGLYLGKSIDAASSFIVVDGAVTSMKEVESHITEGKGYTLIDPQGILMLDQRGIGTKAAVSGAKEVMIAGDATVAVINAQGGTTLQLADVVSIFGNTEREKLATKTVLTDNPFVKGTLTASSGTIALSDYADETGINVIASMGVQSMIRHADAVLAETIADRAAEVTTGNGLWVSVRGERFEQKKLGGGAGFHANMGYGAFGAEFTPTDATSLGVAFQYGFGTVKGKLYSAKNKTKDYGLTLYGSTLLGDTGVKLLGEVSYTKSTNDLTNNYYTGLNQDLDAKMISGGITAQKHFAAGSFDLVPSVGVRVSRITTDAMKAGESRIAKQKQTLVQVPIALRVNAKAIETEGGWAITPRFKVAFIPTFGDKEIKIFGAEKTVLDTTPVQGAFGVSFVKGNFTIDATANLGVSNKDTSSIGGKVGLSYRF